MSATTGPAPAPDGADGVRPPPSDGPASAAGVGQGTGVSGPVLEEGAAEQRYENLAVTVDGPVAVVLINRPEKLNALTNRFWPELRDVLTRLGADGRTRAVVLSGAGGRAFSTGGDIVGFGELVDTVARRDFMNDCMAAFAVVEDSPLIVVAAVNGWALGGGCELALACDIVLAAESAVFGMPEAAIGLVPGFGVLRGASVLGRQWLKYMVLAGERLDATRAEQLGMVQRVVPDAELLTTATALAHRVAANAPLALAVGKRMINRGVDRGEFGYTVEAVTMLHSTEDAAEGIQAFRERRPPAFRGR